MKREISIEDAKKIQSNMMNFFDCFCKDKNLKYYLSYGSLLGAIRHKGFIPWDDDIDVVMPINDYNNLLSYFSNGKTIDNYKLLDIHLDPEYYLPYGKLIDTRTVLKENYKIEFEIGVGIDVFPLYNMGDNYRRAKGLFYTAHFIRSLADVKLMKLDAKRSLLKNAALFIGKMLLLPFTAQFITKQLVVFSDSVTKKLNDHQLCNLVGGVYGEREIHKGEWYGEGMEAEFESYNFVIPRNSHCILKRLYGDYMVLPPIDKQISHHKNKAFWRE